MEASAACCAQRFLQNLDCAVHAVHAVATYPGLHLYEIRVSIRHLRVGTASRAVLRSMYEVSLWTRPICVQAVSDSHPVELIDRLDALLDLAGVLGWDRDSETEERAVREFHRQHFQAMRDSQCHSTDAFAKGVLCMVAKYFGKMVCL